MNIYSFSMLLFSFGILLIGALALAKRKDKIAKLFMYFSVSVSGWGFLWAFFMTQYYSQETELFLARLLHVFAAFIPICWLHFVFEYISKKEPFKHFYLFNYCVTLFLSITALTPLFI